MKDLEIICQSQELKLHPDKVAYWPAAKTLLVADVHAGKEHILGRAGISIPAGISEDTLDHLFALVDHYCAERLLILGDFTHGYHTRDEAWIKHFYDHLAQHDQLNVQIVAGNHDKHTAKRLLDKDVVWIPDCLVEPPFVFTHIPKPDERGYVIAGHLHPAYVIQNNSKEKLQAPVFWFQQSMGVLPAFGHFTGAGKIQPETTDRLFITGPDCVIDISGVTASLR